MSRRSFSVWALLVSWLSTGVVGAQEEPSYSLTLEGPKRFSGPPASEVDLSGSYTAFITESGNPDGDSDDPANDPEHRGGAQGWSISIAVDGIDVDGITDEGTDAIALFSGGFKQMEPTTGAAGVGSDCEGFNGAVLAYVLSFTQPITLPVNGTASILVLDCSGTATAGSDLGSVETVARVWFADGCQGGGQPVSNAVTWNGTTIAPETEGCDLDLETVEVDLGCPIEEAELQVVISNAVTDDPFEPARIDVEAQPGETGAAEVIGAIRSNIPEEDELGNPRGGVQGWALSAALVEGDIVITGASEYDDGIGPFFDGGFIKTEITDKFREGSPCDGLTGAISAVVLSFTLPITLDLVGDTEVLLIEVEGAVQDGDDGPVGSSGLIEWRDGCQGVGQPVDNVATVNGNTERFACCQSVVVSVNPFVPPPEIGPLLPCDANADAKVNLADAIYVINALIRGGAPFTCASAADCNQDFLVDLSDAITIAHGLFGLASLPPLECIVVPAESVPVQFVDVFTCEQVSCP